MSDFGLTVSAIGFLFAQFFAVRDAVRGRTTITLAASVPTALLLGNTSFWLLYLHQPVAASMTGLSVLSWGFLAWRRVAT